MKVLDFNNKEHILKLTGKTVLNDDIRPKSQYHLAARELLKKVFPFATIYEEVYLPVGLYADFLIPSKRICIEVNGSQHTEFSPHFHKTKANFAKAKVRDSKKAEFCQINNIKLVSLDYKDDLETWTKQLKGL